MRVVIAHDFAETYGGAERVVEALARTFPEAPVWAILGRPAVARRMGVAERFHTVLPGPEWLLRRYRGLVPLYPVVARARRVPPCDVLITSHYAFAHWFRALNDAPQLCYCHSPLRFAWSMTEAYAADPSRRLPARRAIRPLAAAMRTLDRRGARAVARYVANSRHVADQIRTAYGRDAEVVWPPVDCDRFRPGEGGHDGYFLICSRLVEPYKRTSLAIEAFASLPERLVIAGDGPALPELRRRARSNVEFVGHVEDAQLIRLMQRCAAALFPSRDDFGLTPVEVMACGRPVLAFASGGALETVIPGRTGAFFEEQSVEALRAAITDFDPDAYDPDAVRRHAEQWHIDGFARRIRALAQETAGTNR